MSLINRVGEALVTLREPAVTVLGLPPPERRHTPPAAIAPTNPSAPVGPLHRAAAATSYELAKALQRIRMPERWIDGGVINARIAQPYEGGLARTGPSGLSYNDLRDLADHADLVRIAIEDAKAMIAGLDWELERDGGGDADPRAEALCMKPDGEQDWDSWATQIVEELLVTDCVMLFPWYRGGRLERLELIDGATVEIQPDPTGRIPRPPSQPLIQRAPGAPERRYSTDELWYRPRNRRIRHLRGYSAVEQIVMRAEINIHQTLVDLSKWLSGGVPPGIIGTPDGMDLEQLKLYQEWLDDRVLAKENLSRLLAVAGNPKYASIIAQTLDKGAAELLIRIVFHSIGVDASSLLSQINYSTADAIERWSRLRGIMPQLYYLKARAGEALAAAGFPDHTLVWKAEREARESLARKDDREDYSVGLIAWEEARLRRGLPIEGPEGDPGALERYHWASAPSQGIPGQALGAGGGDLLTQLLSAGPRAPVRRLPPGEEEDTAEADPPDLSKAVRAELRQRRKVHDHDLRKGGTPRPFAWRLAPGWVRYRVEAGLAKGMSAREATGEWLAKAKATGVNDDQDAVAASRKLAAYWDGLLTMLIEHYQAAAVAALEAGQPALAKASRAPDLPPPAFDESTWDDLLALLEDAYEAGDRMAAGIVGYGSKAARAYAEERAGALLGRRWDGMQWVERAGIYSVPDAVRQEVHDLTVQAITEGWDVGTLNDALYLKFESTPGRSLTIARTESGMAYNEATVASYAASGVELVLVYDGPGCLPLGHDDDAEPPEDVVGLQLDREANGQRWPVDVAKQYMLSHPNCGRSLAPVLPDD